MSAMTSIREQGLGRPATIVLAVLAAALMNAYALGVAASPNPPYFLTSLIAAVPVALLVGLVAARWPPTAAFGLVGLVAFSAALAAQVSMAAPPNPLPIAVVCVLAAGGATIVAGRARWRDLLGGLLLTYATAAALFYVSLLL
jgi:hypothetical protein